MLVSEQRIATQCSCQRRNQFYTCKTGKESGKHKLRQKICNSFFLVILYCNVHARVRPIYWLADIFGRYRIIYWYCQSSYWYWPYLYSLLGYIGIDNISAPVIFVGICLLFNPLNEARLAPSSTISERGCPALDSTRIEWVLQYIVSGAQDICGSFPKLKLCFAWVGCLLSLIDSAPLLSGHIQP
jgi:hypothetical protein